MTSKRDDFSPKTKQTLYRRCGAMCSHPKCGKITFGPSSNPNKSTNIGFAAHIKGARDGGARYDKTQTSEERKSPENGIWLCGTHAKIIDDDETKYTVELLTYWKNLAEERAENAQDNPALITNSSAYAETSLILVRHYPFKKTILDYKKSGQKVTIKPLFGEYNVVAKRMPLVLAYDIPKGHSLISVCCENTGLGIDKDISFSVELSSMGFVKTDIQEPSRLMLVSGGKNNSTFARFTIPTLLPDECQGINLLIKEPNSFIANITSFSSKRAPLVNGFDAQFDEPVENKTPLKPKQPMFMGNAPINSFTCEIHGKQSPRRVCQHIASTVFSDESTGFNVDVMDPGEFYDAWCDKCNDLMELYDHKWLPEMMPLVKPTFICSECYERKKTNRD